MKLKASLALAFGLLAGAAYAADTELVVATVNNGHMIEMQKHTKVFEAANPGIKLKWVTLEEGVLRQRVTTDIATKGGQFDVMTIGMSALRAGHFHRKQLLAQMAERGAMG